MLDAPVPGKGRGGRQKTRWKYLCKRSGKCGVRGGGRRPTGQDKVEEKRRFSVVAILKFKMEAVNVNCKPGTRVSLNQLFF